jgi:Predicted membrane protein
MGTGFLVHGWAKWSRGPGEFGKLLQQIGLPMPELTAWAVTILELAGGFALIIGAFVVFVSVPLMISMFTAMITVNLRYGFSAIKTIGLTATGPVFGPPGYEINLLYIAGLLSSFWPVPVLCRSTNCSAEEMDNKKLSKSAELASGSKFVPVTETSHSPTGHSLQSFGVTSALHFDI